MRFVAGLVDVLAVALDAGGPEGLIELYSAGGERPAYRDPAPPRGTSTSSHLQDVLEAISARHPVEAIARGRREFKFQRRGRVARAAARCRRTDWPWLFGSARAV